MNRSVSCFALLLTSAMGGATALAACGVEDGNAGCESYSCLDDDDKKRDGALDPDGQTGEDSGIPFEPASPATYVPKVKTILTGLAATDEEIAAVTADPNALRGLIDQWMARPEFRSRALDFFRNAFQQNQVTLEEMMDAHGAGAAFLIHPDYRTALSRSIMDSFPLTVWRLVSEGRPLSDALTTDTFELTTAQLAVLSYLDDMRRNDDFSLDNRLASKVTVPVRFDPNTNATLAEAANPDSPNFMLWRSGTEANATCAPAPESLPNAGNKFIHLLRHLFGSTRCMNPALDPPEVRNRNTQPRFSDEDFVATRSVRILPAGTADTASPPFYDIPSLRNASVLRLRTPRVGFAGTLAFATNWPTNAGNDARVIANQMLIVGIGRSINGENSNSTFSVDVTDVDEAHSSNPECARCHVQIDPARQYVKQSWSLYYHDQKDTTQLSVPAAFNVDGVTATGSGLGDFLSTMASHPRFAVAWTNKLYFWATSHGASELDPEFIRIADAFRASGHDFKTLVRELFSSPLLTYAKATPSTAQPGGDAPSIARRDQYCTALSNRLGLDDVCGMLATKPTRAQSAIAQTATMIAADGYFRSFELPSLPTTPDLFFRASTESICEQIGNLLVDVEGDAPGRYDSANPASAIADMVQQVMGLPPSDPRHAAALQILTEHHAAALAIQSDAGTITAKDALKSTFQLACLSPSSVVVGL